MELIRQKVTQGLNRIHERAEKAYNTRSKLVEFSVGQVVYVNSCRPNLAAKKKALPALRESKVRREMRAREREQSARLTYFKVCYLSNGYLRVEVLDYSIPPCFLTPPSRSD